MFSRDSLRDDATAAVDPRVHTRALKHFSTLNQAAFVK
jgi:hypothetical protein